MDGQEPRQDPAPGLGGGPSVLGFLTGPSTGARADEATPLISTATASGLAGGRLKNTLLCQFGAPQVEPERDRNAAGRP